MQQQQQPAKGSVPPKPKIEPQTKDATEKPQQPAKKDESAAKKSPAPPVASPEAKKPEIPVVAGEKEKDKETGKKKEITPEKLRKKQAKIFERYLKESGLSVGFEIIFREIVAKKIPADQVFTFAALRLRQLNEEISKLAPQEKPTEQEEKA